MSRRRVYAHLRDGTVSEPDASAIDTLLRDEQALLWLDIEAPGPEDASLLRDEFGFHELAIEDALRGRQRAKVDEYPEHYFVVVYGAALGERRELETREIRFFWGKNYVVTLHDEPVGEVQQAVDRWAASHERRHFGVAYQVYALLDAVIDGYFPVIDEIADRIEDLETRIFSADSSIVREVFGLRKELLDARKALAPSRDVLNELLRRHVPGFPSALVPYLADVYDHSIRAIDTLDLHRDLLASAVESHLSVTSNRLNQTMRALTALTITLMVPTLIAGIYGMNFEYIPELKWVIGYPLALGTMAAAVAVLLLLFRRSRWL